MTTNRDKRRVFVGVDGSLPSLRALREAASAARQRGAELHVVHVRRPSPTMPAMPFLIPSNPDAPRQHSEPLAWADSGAMDLIVTCLRNALGGDPVDLDVHRRVLIGRPGKGLASLGCRDSDLIVVGTGGARRWHHVLRRSVSRYCAAHSRCPVLVVPRDEFARTMHRTRERRVPRDAWREFDATASRETHPTR